MPENNNIKVKTLEKEIVSRLEMLAKIKSEFKKKKQPIENEYDKKIESFEDEDPELRIAIQELHSIDKKMEEIIEIRKIYKKAKCKLQSKELKTRFYDLKGKFKQIKKSVVEISKKNSYKLQNLKNNKKMKLNEIWQAEIEETNKILNELEQKKAELYKILINSKI